MSGFLETYFPNVLSIQEEMIEGIWETLYMVSFSALIASILGIILGIILVVTEEGGVLENSRLYYFLERAVNVFRSVPFIIMLALIAPITR
ncbi:MAG TPA: ABC transporter permease, partial [Pseudogracilibacillus sp.]|nr:ABC transporter permease [Pseudogracilibacillus sp.]